jgi:hypothetical protein
MVALFLNTPGGDDFLVRFSGQICHRNKEPTASFRELGGGTNSEEMMRWQGGGTDRPSRQITQGSTATTDKDFSPERERERRE